MVDVSYLASLIGKSERDDNVVEVLSSLGLPTSLKRPKRGEDEINLVAENYGIEVAFKTSESFSQRPDSMLEGELILYAVFVRASTDPGNSVSLPFGLTFNQDRRTVHALLGAPNWSSPMLNNDRWLVNETKMLLCFDDDWNSIKEIVFSR